MWFSEEDIENFKLPWCDYPNGNGQWIFEDKCQPLAAKIRSKGGKLKIGDYIYVLKQGDTSKFIQRFPIRKHAQ